MSDETRTSDPHDRLTRLCDAMSDALDAHPERGDEKCIVFLSSEKDKRGGMQMYGYDDDWEAMTDVFLHLRAVFRANGKDLAFAPMPGHDS